jgi:selenide,water dikinase
LIGHLLEVLEGSGLAAEIRLADVPVFDGVRGLMRRKRVDALTGRRRFPGSEWIHATFGGHPIPGGTHQNMAHQTGRVRLPPMLPVEEAYLLSDPQTSGGLLMFVPEASAGALCDALRAAGEGAWRIGRTLEAGALPIPRVTVV